MNQIKIFGLRIDILNPENDFPLSAILFCLNSN